MKETYYNEAGSLLWSGVGRLCLSVAHTMENHPARFMLVVSVIVNVVLFVSLANARVDRDRYNYEATTAERKVDSLEMLSPYWHKSDSNNAVGGVGGTKSLGLMYKILK